MKGKSYLIDTDILIDYLKGDLTPFQFLGNRNIFSISVITAGELLQGARNRRELREIEKLLDALFIVPITPEISYRAIELIKAYRLRYGLLLMDALIASTALCENFILITKNYKHFRFIEDLEVKKWI